MKTLLLMFSCCDCKESTIFSVLFGFSLLLKANLYYSREGVLQTFGHTTEIDLQRPRKERKFSCKIIADAVSVKSTILYYMWASFPFEVDYSQL